MDIGHAEKIHNDRISTHMEIDRESGKSPNVGGIPASLEYISQYTLDVAYVMRTQADEPLRKTRQRIRQGLLTIHSANGRNEMRILREHSETNWKLLWLKSTQHGPQTPECRRGIWRYTTSHLPTNACLQSTSDKRTDAPYKTG
jgi:hypothetical protein